MKTALKIINTVLHKRLKRHEAAFKELDFLVNTNVASPQQKQQYIEVSAKIMEVHDIIDLMQIF